MEANEPGKEPILILGDGKLVYSVVVCLLQAGHPVRLFTKNMDDALKNVNLHFADLAKNASQGNEYHTLEITDVLEGRLDYKLAIAIIDENLLKKKAMIHQLEEMLPLDSTIAINTESIPLSILLEGSNHPGRIIGLNWVDPAHTTYFLELVTNSNSDEILVDRLFSLAKKCWNKDPYVIYNDLSIRAKLFAAMIREAFYLVENGYASIEDIDRSCRNDAGYYLPFAGNFRFIDLMGTYAYGMVMKDLNPELSKECKVPEFFKNIIEQGDLGMENNKGFYKYENGEAEKWEELFKKFSYQIQDIITKYPFNYKSDGFSPNQIKSEMYE
ncbi:MAG: 3-hydroxyacyl-CoA dehydrogenase NAD-binding domain-containing protein [Ginsengibacter sp.]